MAPGNYSFSTSLTIPENTFIQGSGKDSTLIQTSVGQDFIYANSGVRFEHLTIDGSNTDSNLVVVSDLTSFDVYDCQFQNVFGAIPSAVNFLTPESNTVVIDHCNFINLTGSIVGSGIQIDTDAGNNIQDLKVTNSEFSNVNIGFVMRVFQTSAEIRRLEISDCSFIDMPFGTAQVDVNENIVISRNKCIRGVQGASVRSSSTGPVRAVVSDNIFQGSTSGSVKIDIQHTGTGTFYPIVTHNSISSGGSGEGVFILKGENVIISDNYISETANGIRIDSTSNTVSICNNILSNNSTCLNVSSGSVEGIASGNIIKANSTQTAVTVNDAFRVVDNEQREDITGTGTIKPYTSRAIIDTTSGAFELFVPDLNVVSTGHKLYIELDVDGGDLTITPNTFVDGSNLVFTTAGDFATLEWTGSQWTTTDSNFNYIRKNECGEFCVNNFTDFSAAISTIDAAGGGTVHIAPETITTGASLSLPDNILIKGSGPLSRIVNGQGNGWFGSLITNTANVTVEGLTFDLQGNNISGWSFGENCNNIVFTDCVFTTNTAVGNHLVLGTIGGTNKDWTVKGNRFVGGNQQFGHTTSDPAMERITVTDNYFEDGVQAFRLSGETIAAVVTDNHITNCSTGVILVDSGTPGYPDSSILVKNNILRNNGANWQIDNVSIGLKVIDNFTDLHIVDPSSESIYGYESKVRMNQTSGSGTIAIGDIAATSAGHKMYIELDTLGGTDITLTPDTTHTNFATAGSTATYSTITFNSAGDFVVLEWQGTGWNIISNSGTSIA